MPTPRKIAIIEGLSARMRSAAAIYFTDFRGLSAPEATELRARLRQHNIEYIVVKKTLSRLAAQEAGIGEITNFMPGQTALAFSYDDPAAPARILREFSTHNRDIPTITGMILDGQLLPATTAEELADLPAKEVLIGQLVAVLQQPISRLVSTLNGVIIQLVWTLSSLKERKSA
ncbi:MAG: 50S ribosomal protein L10 [Candidatus Neomarinimicrobiota bacterium]